LKVWDDLFLLIVNVVAIVRAILKGLRLVNLITLTLKVLTLSWGFNNISRVLILEDFLIWWCLLMLKICWKLLILCLRMLEPRSKFWFIIEDISISIVSNLMRQLSLLRCLLVKVLIYFSYVIQRLKILLLNTIYHLIFLCFSILLCFFRFWRIVIWLLIISNLCIRMSSRAESLWTMAFFVLNEILAQLCSELMWVKVDFIFWMTKRAYFANWTRLLPRHFIKHSSPLLIKSILRSINHRCVVCLILCEVWAYLSEVSECFVIFERAPPLHFCEVRFETRTLWFRCSLGPAELESQIAELHTVIS
jgi:hypothetical protein